MFLFISGISFGQLLIQSYGCITYNVVIMYCIYYFFASFTSKLPWIGCDNRWNTDLCSDRLDQCLERDGIITFNNTCLSFANLTNEDLSLYNITFGSFGTNDTEEYNLVNYTDPFSDQRLTPSEEYWRYFFLLNSFFGNKQRKQANKNK